MFFAIQNKFIVVHVGGDVLVPLGYGHGQVLRVLPTYGEGGVIGIAAEAATLLALDVEGGFILTNMAVNAFRQVICEDYIEQWPQD